MQISEWELWWRQTLDFTVASMKSRYRKTMAGFLWVLLNPVIMFGVQSVVFRKFLRLDMPDYYLFLVGGLIPWIFMTQTIQMGTSALVANSPILRSFRVHPLMLVGASVLDNFINFIFTLLIIVTPVVLFSDKGFSWNLLWAPVTLLPLVLVAFSFTMLMAVVNVFYRDANFVLGFIFSVFFFLTPVFYPVEFVPANYRWLIDFNILFHAIAPFRSTIYSPEPYAWVPLWLTGMGWGLGLTILATLYWRKKRNELFIAL
jgi:ABC-type polysaccharide/polyol phosphate export permease